MHKTDKTPVEKVSKINVLYVDDEPNNVLSFKASFRRIFHVFTAESAQEGEKILANNHIEVILTDHRMPNVTGVEFLQSALKSHPDTIRILVTGYSDIQSIIDAVNHVGIFHYVQKPWVDDYLKKVIYNASEIYRLRKANNYLMEELKLNHDQLHALLKEKQSL